jgi:hypothetical protein
MIRLGVLMAGISLAISTFTPFVRADDWNKYTIITTVITRNDYRKERSGRTVLTFWETPAGTPLVLRAWFWPGDYWGQEFVYPEALAAQIAKTSHQQVPTLEAQKLP